MSRISINLSMAERSSDQPINQPFGSSPQTSLRKKSFSANAIGRSMSLPDKLDLLDSVRNRRLSATEILTLEIGSPLGSMLRSPSESPRISKNSFTLITGSVTRQGNLLSIDEGTIDFDESIRGSTVNEVLGSEDSTVVETHIDYDESSHPLSPSNDKARSLEERALALSRITKILDQNEYILENHSSSQRLSLDSHLNASAIVRDKPRHASAKTSYSPLIDRFPQPSTFPSSSSSSSSVVVEVIDLTSSQVGILIPSPSTSPSIFDYRHHLLPYPVITKYCHRHDFFVLL